MNKLALPTGVAKEEERDSLGGGTLPAGVYKGTVDMVYLDKAASGAICVVMAIATEGRVVRQTTYISNKAGEFTYGQGKEKKPLPGYTQMDNFFIRATGKGIGEQETEEKTIKVFDFTQRKDVNAQKDVFTGVLNLPIAVGLLDVKEEKSTKESGYKQGTGEFRAFNEFVKWFDPDTGLTTKENADGVSEPTFLKKWKEQYEGKVTTRLAKITGTTKGASGVSEGMPSNTAATPATGMFDK